MLLTPEPRPHALKLAAVPSHMLAPQPLYGVVPCTDSQYRATAGKTVEALGQRGKKGEEVKRGKRTREGVGKGGRDARRSESGRVTVHLTPEPSTMSLSAGPPRMPVLRLPYAVVAPRWYCESKSQHRATADTGEAGKEGEEVKRGEREEERTKGREEEERRCKEGPHQAHHIEDDDPVWLAHAKATRRKGIEQGQSESRGGGNEWRKAVDMCTEPYGVFETCSEISLRG
ncbi:hypothetical protein B0H13DRAFT_1875999 [Mycena leptocephala]|nr:hypothetical protein B0H13DRAFT_1875999 [Mycena leptocephala]